jgi:hypothetical protein
MAGEAADAALAAWQALNARQRGTLAVVYELDQLAEAGHQAVGGGGDFDRSPAAEWRRIDFAHVPAVREMITTEMQSRLGRRGWDNQGNGSTVAALARRGLIREGSRATAFGTMLTVRLTTEGRAAARAGIATPAGRKAALGQRTWEVLALLWQADVRGEVLRWNNSTTIEKVLIGRRLKPLAEQVPAALLDGRLQGGYRITDRGRRFYREHYAAHVAAWPEVKAPHPDGTAAEPWPPEADEVLNAHRDYYRALCAQWQAASDACESARTEAAAAAPEVPATLPAAVAGQAAARHRLWTGTAGLRADLAAAHAGDLEARAERAARAYAVAALAAFRAAAARISPLDVLEPPGEAGDWDGQRLAPPAETGIHAIDAEARELHATAIGAPPAKPGMPGSGHAALADFLRGHTDDGVLLRRLHPPPERLPRTGAVAASLSCQAETGSMLEAGGLGLTVLPALHGGE